MLAPSPRTADVPGIGGRIRARSEDFAVDEIAAYAADGREERHLLVRFEKFERTTAEALSTLARHAGVDRREVGVAGQKDKWARTRQWASFPWAARAALEGFAADGLRVLAVEPHGQKLRTGHLHGNRFEIVVRDLAVAPDEAVKRVHAKLERLRELGGLDNLYGEQRFGFNGRNLDVGLPMLASGRLDRRKTFEASAAQSGVFNLYISERVARGIDRVVLAGDVLRKTDTGGLFTSDDAELDTERLLRGELQITGPIAGGRTRWCAPDSPSAVFEDEILAQCGLSREGLARFGKKLPGSRRPTALAVPVEAEIEAGTEELSEGILLRFSLPPGSFATQLLRELQCGSEEDEETT